MTREFYENMIIECYDCHEIIHVHEDDIVDEIYVVCPTCGEHLVLLD